MPTADRTDGHTPFSICRTYPHTIKNLKQKEMITKNQAKNYAEYVTPQCYIMRAETESFICTSVTPNANGSGSEGWNGETSHEGGTGYLGGDDDVAPGKVNPWANEEP